MKRLLLLSLAIALAVAGLAGLSHVRTGTAAIELNGIYDTQAEFGPGSPIGVGLVPPCGQAIEMVGTLWTAEVASASTSASDPALEAAAQFDSTFGTTVAQELTTALSTEGTVFLHTAQLECGPLGAPPTATTDGLPPLTLLTFGSDGFEQWFEFGLICVRPPGDPVPGIPPCPPGMVPVILQVFGQVLPGGDILVGQWAVFDPLTFPSGPPLAFGSVTKFFVGPLPGDVAIPVDIDIKPGSDPNAIKLADNGTIPVAILSSATFDASTVDPNTVRLDSAGVRVVGGKNAKLQASLEDVNGDGLPDLVVHFDRGEFEPVAGATTATVTGNLLDGTLIEGSDSIELVN